MIIRTHTIKVRGIYSLIGCELYNIDNSFNEHNKMIQMYAVAVAI